MSPAALAAGAAGALAVLAAWETLTAIETARVSAAVRRIVAPLDRAGREGREPTARERRRLGVLAAATLAGGGWLLAGLPAAIVLGTAGPWLAFAAIRARRARYAAELERGAPVLARALADAIAGGHSIRGAIPAVARSGGLQGPVGGELDALAGALELGEPTDEALERLRRRAGGRAFETIVAAILLQREAGGDLGGLLRGVAEATEDANRLQRDVRVATAQARFTGLLVTALPVGAAALAELASPGYLAGLLRSPLTAWLAGCAILLQSGALIVIARLARPRL